MKSGEARRLDREYAVKRTALGWYVFAYSNDQGEIHENIYAGHVLLSDWGARELADYVCSEVDGCDLLKDTRSDLAASVERVRELQAAMRHGG